MPADHILIENFLESLAGEYGSSNATLESYADGLGLFRTFLSRSKTSLAEVTHSDVIGFIKFLDERGYAEGTVTNRCSIIRSFYRFMVEDGVLERNPTSLMEPMKRRRSLPVVMTVSEVDILLAHVNKEARDTGQSIFQQASMARRAAILETLYASGMRVSEAIQLPARVLNANDRLLMVRGKGKKDRLVPLHQSARDAMSLWRRLANEYGSASEKWLFHSVRDGDCPLTRQAVYEDIQKATREAGISNPKRVTPHVLRHAFATHLLSGGADLRVIQMLLGHADLGTTEIYTHVSNDRAIEMVSKLHPLATAGAEAKTRTRAKAKVSA